jgi:hypothetical protein
MQFMLFEKVTNLLLLLLVSSLLVCSLSLVYLVMGREIKGGN